MKILAVVVTSLQSCQIPRNFVPCLLTMTEKSNSFLQIELLLNETRETNPELLLQGNKVSLLMFLHQLVVFEEIRPTIIIYNETTLHHPLDQHNEQTQVLQLLVLLLRLLLRHLLSKEEEPKVAKRIITIFN